MDEMIATDPDVMMGKPVIRETRITVESIVSRVASGESIQEVVEAHPQLTRGAVLAALSFDGPSMEHLAPLLAEARAAAARAGLTPEDVESLIREAREKRREDHA